MKKIAIIGAGITGLTIAQRLQSLATVDLQIDIFEKSRGVSGRTSTRRAEPYQFDHGAPFFTAKSARFQEFLEPMIDGGMVTDWQANVAEISGTEIQSRYQWLAKGQTRGEQTEDGQANKQQDSHFVGTPKMNAIAKHMAQQLTQANNNTTSNTTSNHATSDVKEHQINIHLGTRIGKITQIASSPDSHNLPRSHDSHGSRVHQWQLTSEVADNFESNMPDILGIFDWVICTTPAEQAAALVPDYLPFYPRITQTSMQGCYTLMLGFDKKIAESLQISFDVALIKESDLSCIIINSHKPNRTSQAYSMTVLSSNQWAEEHIDDDQNWVKSHLLQVASDTIGYDLTGTHKPEHIAMHRWRYANTSNSNSAEASLAEASFLLDSQNGFAVAGDWLIKSSVENAFISADNLATALLKLDGF